MLKVRDDEGVAIRVEWRVRRKIIAQGIEPGTAEIRNSLFRVKETLSIAAGSRIRLFGALRRIADDRRHALQ